MEPCLTLEKRLQSTTVVNFKKTDSKALMPTKGSEYSAGVDLYACLDDEITIRPHETEMIDTGIAMELPKGTFGGIFPRSGIATKQGLRPANTPGCIDSDFRGSIKVALHNDTDIPQLVQPQERIAQLVIIPFLSPTLCEVNELSSTERGEGGFGSTGQF